MSGFDNLSGFLEHISLVMDGDNEAEAGEVSLMTLHAAKGLEFEAVFYLDGKKVCSQARDLLMN